MIVQRQKVHSDRAETKGTDWNLAAGQEENMHEQALNGWKLPACEDLKEGRATVQVFSKH